MLILLKKSHKFVIGFTYMYVLLFCMYNKVNIKIFTVFIGICYLTIKSESFQKKYLSICTI